MGPAHAVAVAAPAPQQGPGRTPAQRRSPSLDPGLLRDALTDSGAPVEGRRRLRVERATGVDLSGVRLHTGPHGRLAARALRAAAFTSGADIVVATAPGQPVPQSLLDHELAHAAQFRGGRGGSAAGAERQATALASSDGGEWDADLVRPAAGEVACAPEDWLTSTVDVRNWGLSALLDEQRALTEWLDRQVASTPETDRVRAGLEQVEAQIAQRRGRIQQLDRPAARQRRGRGQRTVAPPTPEELPPQTEMPRVLRERTSTQLTDPAEIRTEADRIARWLERPDLNRADRAVLHAELRNLAPALGADLQRASAQRGQARLTRALTPTDPGDRASLIANLRLIDSIAPYSARPGMAYVMHEGELLVFPQEIANQVRVQAREALATAAHRAANMNSGTQDRMSDHLRRNYEEHPYVGFVVSVFSREEPVDVQRRMFEPLANSESALSRYRRAVRGGGSLAEMGDAVLTAIESSTNAQQIVAVGVQRSIDTAGEVVQGLEITRNLSFAVALSIGAILAAPVVAAGVAGAGATGLTATALTAGGTGVVVGGEGALLGFTGGAGGELVAGHGVRAALRTGVTEGERVGAQGFAMGLGGGASVGLARNLGAGAAGLSRAGQLWRGAAAGTGGNMLGGMTQAALSDVPAGQSRAGNILSTGMWSGALGAFGGAAGVGSQWLSSPAARFGVGVALPSVVGAGATYAQTGDVSQSLQAGALGLTTGWLAGRMPMGETPTQQRAFQFGRQMANTTRAYVGAAMIGLANVGPSVRMGQSSTPTTLSAATEGQSVSAQPSQATAAVQQEQAPTAQAPTPQAPVQQQAPATAAPAQSVQNPAPLAPIAGAEEVQLTPAQYQARLGMSHPSQFADPLSVVVDGIGQRAAARAVANPRFVEAVQNGNRTLAGTLFHSAAAAEVRALPPGTLPPGWTIDAELVIQPGAGGSRADILLRGPAGQLVEFDWKTTGRSALSYGSRSEMTRHAGQITANIGGALTRQESRTWVDYVRPLLPGSGL